MNSLPPTSDISPATEGVAFAATAVDRLKAKHETSWEEGYRHFPAVIEQLGLRTGVEIGVAFGGHSEAILSRCPAVTRLYGVDSYRHRADYVDPMNLPQPQFDQLYEKMVSRLSAFGDRFVPVRKDSAEAVTAVPDGIDFVYVDADHSYQGVFDDLCRWAPKVRPGGVVGGHDYGHPDFPGVRRAVDEFFRRFGWEVHAEGEGVWWVQIAPLHVSFVMPAYNRAALIGESIGSILNGNIADGDELLVVDDGSTDDTPRVLRDLAAANPAIRVVTHARNKGGGAARNTAVEHARHPLIFCLDSDNLLAPNSVPPLVAFLKRSGADVVGFETFRYFDNSPEQVTHEWRMAPHTTLADYLAGHKVLGSSGNYLFTRDSWLRAGGYPEFAGALDTWGFGLRQVATGSHMATAPGSFYHHRHGHDSYWTRQDRTDLFALQVLLPFLHLLNPRDADYVTSRRGRSSWLANLPNRPLRVRPRAEAKDGGDASAVGAAAPGIGSALRAVARRLRLRKIWSKASRTLASTISSNT